MGLDVAVCSQGEDATRIGLLRDALFPAWGLPVGEGLRIFLQDLVVQSTAANANYNERHTASCVGRINPNMKYSLIAGSYWPCKVQLFTEDWLPVLCLV